MNFYGPHHPLVDTRPLLLKPTRFALQMKKLIFIKVTLGEYSNIPRKVTPERQAVGYTSLCPNFSHQSKTRSILLLCSAKTNGDLGAREGLFKSYVYLTNSFLMSELV